MIYGRDKEHVISQLAEAGVAFSARPYVGGDVPGRSLPLSSKPVVLVHADESEIVVVRWHLKDGSTFDQDVTLPPKPVREARRGDMWRELCYLLKAAGAVPAIGLRQQGHLPTVEKMLSEGRSWEDIGKAIGWSPSAAEEWYALETTPFFNEACATCGGPADLHRREPGLGLHHWAWGDLDRCLTFVRCDPPRAAYGELPPGPARPAGGTSSFTETPHEP